MQISVFCADIGSVMKGNFGWFGHAGSSELESLSGVHPEGLVLAVNSELQMGHRVALGFECPLFVPVPLDPMRLTSSRLGEGSRAWSAGAGCGALATGLTEVTWILRALRQLNPQGSAYLDWEEFESSETGLFLWEAFVSGKSKAASHIEDAALGVEAFLAAIRKTTIESAITCEEPYSLIGAALLRSGWSTDLKILEKACLVVSATAPSGDSETSV